MRRSFRRHLVIGPLCWVLCAGGEEGFSASAAWAEEAPPALQERSYELLEVYLSEDDALGLLFPEATRAETDRIELTEEQAARVKQHTGVPLAERHWTIHRALRDDHLKGYAVVTNEVGRFHDITFMVGVTPQGQVARVEVLIYRESRGGEVRHRRFLHQYEGKSLDDPIRLNRDILNITGATLSVRAINRGVRNVLGVIKVAYGVAP